MNRQFPALSGVALVIMVLNHAITLGLQAGERFGFAPPSGLVGQVLITLRNLGVFAVPIFLFIAGAFVAYAARGEPPALSRQFVFRSVTHILWPYLLWSTVFYLLVFADYGERSGPLGYIRNLVTGYPYHFVPLLLLCYLLAPLFARVARRHGLWLLAGIALYQLLLIAIAQRGILGVTLPAAARVLAPPVLRGPLTEWALFFPLGLVYGMNARTWQPALFRWRWALVAATAALFTSGRAAFCTAHQFRAGEISRPDPAGVVPARHLAPVHPACASARECG